MSFFRNVTRAVIVIPIVAIAVIHTTNPLLGKWEAAKDGDGRITSGFFARRLEFSCAGMKMEGGLANGSTPVIYWPSFDQWNVIFLNGNSLSVKVDKDRLVVSMPMEDAVFQRMKN